MGKWPHCKFYEKKSIQVCTNIETHTQWVCNPFLIGRLKIMWSSFFLRKPFLRRRQWWLSTRPDGFVVVVTRLWGWREKINPTLKTFQSSECFFEMVKWETWILIDLHRWKDVENFVFIVLARNFRKFYKY
jgi:hypothetical protein